MIIMAYNKQRKDTIISWIFLVIFMVFGVFNFMLIHFVPGLIYFILALFFLPATNAFLKIKIGFSIPLSVKIVLGLLVLWASLAVGDLWELFEAWLQQ